MKLLSQYFKGLNMSQTNLLFETFESKQNSNAFVV